MKRKNKRRTVRWRGRFKREQDYEVGRSSRWRRK
jgi:hypothetical protein